MSTQLLNWLNESGYPIESLRAEYPKEGELIDFIAPLTDYSVIRVSGIDAEKFLQGQFSCDIREVNSEQSRMGTANTAKGRAYAIFRIAKQGDDYLIRLPSVIANDVYERLKKYIVFSKATLTLDDSIYILGFSGESSVLDNLLNNADQLPTEVDGCIHIGSHLVIKVSSEAGTRFEIWTDFEMVKSLLPPLANDHSKISFGTQALWNWSEINEGIAEIYPDTQESYVPQMLNLQHLNAISFKKGCYTGQEIVARMKYLGKLKKEMFLLSTTSENLIPPGADIYEKSTGKKIGSAVRAINHSNTHNGMLLAVLDIEAAKANIPLSLSEDNSQAFTYLSLPYKNETES